MFKKRAPRSKDALLEHSTKRTQLAPEISLVRDTPNPRAESKVREAEAPISMLAFHPEEGPSEPKAIRRTYSGMSQQWTTVLLGTLLFFVARSEFAVIHASGSTGPHSSNDLLLRYLFSVGLSYVSMVVLQFFFVFTLARRWYFALLAMGLSIFVGNLVGDRLDQFAQFRRAEIENRVPAAHRR